MTYQRGIPKSEYPKHKALISWLNPKYTCRVAIICFAACAVFNSTASSDYLNDNIGFFEQGALDATSSHSSLHFFIHTLSRRHERVFATKSPRIFGILQKFEGFLDSFIILGVPLSWHSAIQKILESSDEHKPDIGESLYCMETLHLLLARSCRRSVICFHRFLLKKNLLSRPTIQWEVVVSSEVFSMQKTILQLVASYLKQM